MPDLVGKVRQLKLQVASLKPLPLTFADHDYFNAFLKSKQDVEPLLSVPLKEASILILGCGYRYPDVLLYSGFSESVYGLDIENVFYRDGFLRLYKAFKRSGESALASFFKTYKRRNGMQKYYERIHALSGFKGRHQELNLLSYDGKKIPFEDGQFDAVLSNAVLEHVVDLETFFREVSRVTKPQGVSYHLFHNYYSFSGSHLPESLCEKYPWGHLRGKYHTDPNYLNQVTIEALSEIFSSWFTILNVFQVSKDHSKKGVDETFSYEREGLLTPHVRDELRRFSAEQLLTRAYLIVGKRREELS